MAKKTSQSIRDRLWKYKKTSHRRSFFDALTPEAQQFLRDIRELYQAEELDLSWVEVYSACKQEYPKARWPSSIQSMTRWIRGET